MYKYKQFHLRLLCLLCLVVTVQNTSIAQKQLLGNLTNSSFEAIEFATVQLDSNNYTSTDRNGFFSLSIPQEVSKVRLIIRALGHETIDTVINLSYKKNYLKLQMTEKTFYLKEVEIKPEFTVYDRKNWTIHDFVIDQDKIVVLYSWFKKRKLGVYNLVGESLQSYEIDNSYKSLEKSYLNTFLLLGKKEFIELAFEEGKLKEIGKNSIDFYETLIQGCIAEVNDALLFKKYSIHNKRVQYYTYNDATKRTMVYEVFDLDGAIISQSYYNEIISLYKMEANSNGFNRIDEGLWDGNMLDLAITVPLMRIISQFLHLELKEVKADEFLINDTLYVLSYIDEVFQQIDLKTNKAQKMTLSGFEWKSKNDHIVQDQLTKAVFLIKEEKNIYSFNNTLKNAGFEYRKVLNIKGSFPEKFVLSNNVLFYISYDYKNRSILNRLFLSDR